jgi:hypothetical protein
MRFILQLMPLLTASPVPGHVISVYAGGFEDGTSPGELPIDCPPPATYGVAGVRKHASFMKTFFFEELAEKHAGKLSLSHIFPGLVDGPGFYSTEMPAWFRFLWRLLKPLSSFIMTSPDVCGQVMLYLGTSSYPAKGTIQDGQNAIGEVEVAKSTKGEVGGGSYTLGERADVKNVGMSYEKVRTKDTGQQVWDHTMSILERIEKENVRAA